MSEHSSQQVLQYFVWGHWNCPQPLDCHPLAIVLWHWSSLPGPKSFVDTTSAHVTSHSPNGKIYEIKKEPRESDVIFPGVDAEKAGWLAGPERVRFTSHTCKGCRPNFLQGKLRHGRFRSSPVSALRPSLSVCFLFLLVGPVQAMRRCGNPARLMLDAGLEKHEDKQGPRQNIVQQGRR